MKIDAFLLGGLASRSKTLIYERVYYYYHYDYHYQILFANFKSWLNFADGLGQPLYAHGSSREVPRSRLVPISQFSDQNLAGRARAKI